MEISGGRAEQLHGEEVEEYVFLLRTIFPIDHWSDLRYFGISHMLVQMDDLINFLASLRSLRSVELSHLAWSCLEDNYKKLLDKMRDGLDWRWRPIEERPEVRIVASAAEDEGDGWFVEVDEAVYSFLYGTGDNLFEDHLDTIYPERGGVRRDVFDPEFKVPF